MSVATDIIDAVAAAVLVLYPAATVKKRRASEKHPLLTPGDAPQAPGSASPWFVVTGNEGEPISGGTATKVLCKYTVTVHYLTKEIPGVRDETADLRAKQEAVRKRFDVAAFAAVPEVSQIDPEVRAPYTLPFADATVCDSAVELTVETFEARN